MTRDALVLIGSLLLLAVAGDRFIVHVTGLSVTLRIRPMIAGILVGGLGTSIPELIVVPLAVGRGEVPLAIGTVVGSIIANIALGLGLAALARPLRVRSGTVRREVPVSVVAVVLFGLATLGGVSRVEGFGLLATGVVALWLLLRFAREAKVEDSLQSEVIELVGHGARRAPMVGFRVLVALGLMLVAAEGLVRSATTIAGRLGWQEGLLGLTVVAVGTSAPLIASGIQAARRAEADIVIGNVLGGNIFIALFGGALIGVLETGAPVHIAGAPVVASVSLAALAWGLMARGGRVTRTEAAFLVAIFGAFLPLAQR